MSEIESLKDKIQRAKAIIPQLFAAPTEVKNLALNEISKALLSDVEDLREAFRKDSVDTSSLDSLDNMVNRIYQIIALPDPVESIFDSEVLPNEIKLTKMYIPKKILGLIYEKDPLIVLEVAALAIKSGNCLIVQAPSEQEASCAQLVKIVRLGLEAADLSIDTIQIVSSQEKEFLNFNKGLSLVLAKGSQKLIDFCKNNLVLPAEKVEKMVHFYVDAFVDNRNTIEVILDSADSLGTLLVHENAANDILPNIFKSLHEKGFTFRLDCRCWNIFNALFADIGESRLVTHSDWSIHDPQSLNVKMIEHFDAAILHISQYGKGNCEGILSEHPLHAIAFASSVEAQTIIINTSLKYWHETVIPKTYFLDLNHPVKMEDLMNYKILIQGNYHH